MQFIYKTDPKTGKKYRITAASWTSTSCDSITSSRNTPTIVWQPQSLSGSLILTEDQLNAYAEYNGEQISGSFIYSKNIGDKLNPGNNYLSCRFAAQDPYTYEDVNGSCLIIV